MYATSLLSEPWARTSINVDWLANLEKPLDKVKKAYLQPLKIQKGQTETTRATSEGREFKDSNMSFWMQPSVTSETIGVNGESEESKSTTSIKRHLKDWNQLDVFRKTKQNQHNTKLPSDLRWNAPVFSNAETITNVVVFQKGKWCEK